MKKKKKSLSDLIKEGLIEVVSVLPDGKEVFRFTDKFLDQNPELIESMQTNDSDIIFSLWIKGFLNVSMDTEGEACISLNEKSITWVDSPDINKKERAMMYDIIRCLLETQEGE